MTPTTVRMVLVEGENADGVTVDHDVFDITAIEGSATSSAAEQVVAAVLGTKESADAGGHHLKSIGVTWSGHAEAAELRDVLTARGIDDVLLVSELHAAGALAQAVGRAIGYDSTALFFIERDTATLSVVQTDDGSVVKVLSRSLHSADAMAVLTEMGSTVAEQDAPPQGMFVVGSGVDVSEVKAHLASVLSLPIHAPEESELALARGAALAAAHAPTFEASTVGLAYSQDPDEGTTAGGYAAFAAAATEMAPAGGASSPNVQWPARRVESDEDRKPFLLVGSALTSIFIVGVVALVISLAVSIRPTVDQRPSPGENAILPSTQVPAAPPAPEIKPAEPVPPPPPETIQEPVPVVQQAPQAPAPQAPRTVFVDRPAPAQRAPAPAPQAPAPPPPAAPPAPAPPPAAPAPAPAPVYVPPAPAPPVVFWPRAPRYGDWPTYRPPAPTWTPPKPTWTPPKPTWTPPKPTWTPPKPTWTPPPVPTWTPPQPPKSQSPGWPLPRSGKGDSGGSRGSGGGSRSGDNPFWPFG